MTSVRLGKGRLVGLGGWSANALIDEEPTMRLFQHLALATLISFGLSVSFWIAFGVFQITPFILVSLGCAFIGALAGRSLGNWLIVTAAATSLVRLGVFFAVANPFAAL